jgi:hypothetical protein
MICKKRKPKYDFTYRVDRLPAERHPDSFSGKSLQSSAEGELVVPVLRYGDESGLGVDAGLVIGGRAGREADHLGIDRSVVGARNHQRSVWNL